LRPGGYLEIAGSTPLIGCNDGTFPEDTAYAQLSKIYFDIGKAMGPTAVAPIRCKSQIEESGFEAVRENTFKNPPNASPEDRRLKEIGAFDVFHFRDSTRALFMR
jgi:hypothetical protein